MDKDHPGERTYSRPSRRFLASRTCPPENQAVRSPVLTERVPGDAGARFLDRRLHFKQPRGRHGKLHARVAGTRDRIPPRDERLQTRNAVPRSEPCRPLPCTDSRQPRDQALPPHSLCGFPAHLREARRRSLTVRPSFDRTHGREIPNQTPEEERSQTRGADYQDSRLFPPESISHHIPREIPSTLWTRRQKHPARPTDHIPLKVILLIHATRRLLPGIQTLINSSRKSDVLHQLQLIRSHFKCS